MSRMGVPPDARGTQPALRDILGKLSGDAAGDGSSSGASRRDRLQARRLALLAGMKFFILSATVALLGAAEHDWPAYGGGPAGNRCSPLNQINRSNGAKLHVAWTYDTEDGTGDPQTQPIVVGGVLYGVTPTHKVIALAAATGKLIWKFDSGIRGRGAGAGGVLARCRALSTRSIRQRGNRSPVSGRRDGSICARTWGASRGGKHKIGRASCRERV